jgi:hypothetical protein
LAWLACFTEPAREELADVQLRARGFETLYLTRLVRQHRRGSPWIKIPLFRSYIFARTDEPWQVVRRVRGVLDVVRAGDEAVTVPPAVIAELRSRCDDSGIIPPPAIRIGSSYAIVNGNPLAGMCALIEKVGGTHCRAWIGSLRVERLALSDLDPEPIVMTRIEMGRQTRPLSERRKLRRWEAIE